MLLILSPTLGLFLLALCFIRILFISKQREGGPQFEQVEASHETLSVLMNCITVENIDMEVFSKHN